MEKKKMIFGGKCKGKDLVEAMTAAAKAAGRRIIERSSEND